MYYCYDYAVMSCDKGFINYTDHVHSNTYTFGLKFKVINWLFFLGAYNPKCISTLVVQSLYLFQVKILNVAINEGQSLVFYYMIPYLPLWLKHSVLLILYKCYTMPSILL